MRFFVVVLHSGTVHHIIAQTKVDFVKKKTKRFSWVGAHLAVRPRWPPPSRRMSVWTSERREYRTAWQIDQVILAARDDVDDTPLPSARALLGLVPRLEDEELVPELESPVKEPLVELLEIPDVMYDADRSVDSPNIAHSRLAKRWLEGIAKRDRSSLAGESPSMIDLTQLCATDTLMKLPESPTSIVEL